MPSVECEGRSVGAASRLIQALAQRGIRKVERELAEASASLAHLETTAAQLREQGRRTDFLVYELERQRTAVGFLESKRRAMLRALDQR